MLTRKYYLRHSVIISYCILHTSVERFSLLTNFFVQPFIFYWLITTFSNYLILHFTYYCTTFSTTFFTTFHNYCTTFFTTFYNLYNFFVQPFIVYWLMHLCLLLYRKWILFSYKIIDKKQRQPVDLISSYLFRLHGVFFPILYHNSTISIICKSMYVNMIWLECKHNILA